MKGHQTRLSIHQTAFPSAKENMAFDASLLAALTNNETAIRVYIWQKPGITYSFKQTCPKNVVHLDHAIRITGGGIVYHSPGDVVFSIAKRPINRNVKEKPRDILRAISTRIREALIRLNVPLDVLTPTIEKNNKFCQSYPTDYELSVDGKKICGLTIRKFKPHWLVQGIIHASATHKDFDLVMPPLFRIHTSFDSFAIQDALINSLNHR